MAYETEPVEELIDRAVGTREDCEPAFYAVTGSHLYGFATEGESDVDVRGFHLADEARYALLDRPEDQDDVNRDGVTAGFEAFAAVDLVSYELRKFGLLVSEGNFNVLEVVFCGDEVRNDVPANVRALRALVEEHLPLNVPTSYYGMAKHNYRTYLNPDQDAYEPTAKTYLYVLRGLLAARYVLEEETVEADVTALADESLGETALVDDLIAVKRSGETPLVSGDLAARADERIAALLDEIDPPERAETAEFRDAVDDWMLELRG